MRRPAGFYTFERYYVRADAHLEAQDQNQAGRGAYDLRISGRINPMKRLFTLQPISRALGGDRHLCVIHSIYILGYTLRVESRRRRDAGQLTGLEMKEPPGEIRIMIMHEKFRHRVSGCEGSISKIEG
jgi:hypothetical protein